MTPQREPDTATFLQQFTNSVSRALHKQTCRRCNGREYAAGELRVKSNPGIFAHGNHLAKTRPKDDVPLPLLVNRSRNLEKVKVDHWNFDQNPFHSNPKSAYEFEPPQWTVHRWRRLKKLGEASTTKSPKKEINLPERLDVTDKSGQNWEVVQELPQQEQKIPGRLKSVVSSVVIGGESLASQNDPGLGHHTDALEIESQRVAPVHQACKDLEAHQSHHNGISLDINRETVSKTTLFQQLNAAKNKSWTINQAIKNGTISSSLNDDSKLTNGDNTSRSLDLKELYTRRDVKLSTLRIDVGGSLPDNFLHKNRDELRRLYPMFDWRIGMREPREKQATVTTALLADTNDIPVHASTLNLPAHFHHPHRSPSDNSMFASKRHKKAARTGKPKARDLLDAVTQKIEETAMDVEPTRATGNTDKVRPSSGVVPRQPPPTPMDGRRKGTVQIQF